MDTSDEAKLLRMQENLAAIRKVAGWTAQRLADEIGVTRQTISNLERGKTPLTKTQYIAMRYVLNEEIVTSGNETLAKIIGLLVDDPIEEPEGDEGGSVMGSLSATTALLAAGALTGVMTSILPGASLLAPMSVAIAMSSKAARNALEGGGGKKRKEEEDK